MTRDYRLEARLDSREVDNRNPDDMIGWVATVRLPPSGEKGSDKVKDNG